MMNEPSSYIHQSESMNLTTGPMQAYHIPHPQHHVTLNPNDVMMMNSNSAESDGLSMNSNNNHMNEQQFEQTLMMPMDDRNYTHHHHQTISEGQIHQPRYVFVTPGGYVQQVQYKESSESNLPIYMVAQEEPENICMPETNASLPESDGMTFTSPPASPAIEQSTEAAYSNNDLEALELEAKAIEDEKWDSERAHFQKVVATFLQYKEHMKAETDKKLLFIESLPFSQRAVLNDYYAHLEEVQACIDENQIVFNLVCSQEKKIFQNQNDKLSPVNKNLSNLAVPTRFDFDKLQAVLKQIVRDWTLEGEKERSLCYTPIIEEVERRFSMIKQKQDIRVLIPGAGLARLAHELVARNYVVEGNEFSLFMLFASNFILNRCGGNKKFKIHPWVHQYSNVLHHLDQIRPAIFPDIDPADISTKARFSMTAGDFNEIYAHPKQQEAWDCVVTCFFIDCANNIVSYIERIHGILKPGGVWISLGPLLYHYADITGEESIEPPLDFLIEIIKKIGFSVDRNAKLNTKYTENRESMLSYTYTSAFLCCTKLSTVTETSPQPEEGEELTMPILRDDCEGRLEHAVDNNSSSYSSS